MVDREKWRNGSFPAETNPELSVIRISAIFRTAISLYRQSPDDIDLIVLDLIMPGASGSDTFDMLRQINAGVKVLLASGYSIDSQAIELMNRGCNGFIQKPYNLEDLSRQIDEILNS